MKKPTAKTVEEVNIYLEGLALRIPDTSTDNAVARFDGTTGALQNSGVMISDGGEVYAAGFVRDGSGATYDQWFVGGVRRFVTQTVPSSVGFFAADDSGVWSGSGKKVYEIDRATGKFTIMQVGSTAGLEFGSSGPRMMVGTGGPSGIAAPVGSTWRQTDANSSHGSLTGLLWTRVTGPGTNAEGTDWLVDYEGRWVSYTPTIGGWGIGNGTVSGVCTRRGRTMQFRAKLVVGSSTTFAAACTFSLPQSTSAVTTQYSIAQAELVDIGTSTYTASANMTSSVVQVYATGGTYAAYTAMSSTVPFSWTTNDLVVVNGTYEIA